MPARPSWVRASRLLPLAAQGQVGSLRQRALQERSASLQLLGKHIVFQCIEIAISIKVFQNLVFFFLRKLLHANI